MEEELQTVGASDVARLAIDHVIVFFTVVSVDDIPHTLHGVKLIAECAWYIMRVCEANIVTTGVGATAIDVNLRVAVIIAVVDIHVVRVGDDIGHALVVGHLQRYRIGEGLTHSGEGVVGYVVVVLVEV